MYTIYDYSLALVSLIAGAYFTSILVFWLFIWYKLGMEVSREWLSKSWFGATISVLVMYGVSQLTTADYIIINHTVVFAVTSVFILYRSHAMFDDIFDEDE